MWSYFLLDFISYSLSIYIYTNARLGFGDLIGWFDVTLSVLYLLNVP